MPNISVALKFLPFIQSFFFLILFILLSKRFTSGNLMLTYFIVSTLGLLLEMFSEYIYYPTALTSYYISLPIGLAGMPILFFYIKSLTDQSFKFNKKLIIHFIPAIAILLINANQGLKN